MTYVSQLINDATRLSKYITVSSPMIEMLVPRVSDTVKTIIEDNTSPIDAHNEDARINKKYDSSQSVEMQDKLENVPNENVSIQWSQRQILRVTDLKNNLMTNQYLLKKSAEFFRNRAYKLTILSAIFEGIGGASIVSAMAIEYISIPSYIVYSVLIACIIISKAIDRVNARQGNEQKTTTFDILSKLSKKYIRAIENELSEDEHNCSGRSYMLWIEHFMSHLGSSAGEIPSEVVDMLSKKYGT